MNHIYGFKIYRAEQQIAFVPETIGARFIRGIYQTVDAIIQITLWAVLFGCLAFLMRS